MNVGVLILQELHGPEQVVPGGGGVGNMKVYVIHVLISHHTILKVLNHGSLQLVQECFLSSFNFAHQFEDNLKPLSKLGPSTGLDS